MKLDLNKTVTGLVFATVNIAMFFATSISSEALNYTNWSEWSASAPGNTYGRVVETQTQYMYRDKEYTNQATSTLAGWSPTGYKYDDVSNWKSISIIEHDACSIGATVDTSHVNGNTGVLPVARRTYELSGYWYWDEQSNAGWRMFASPSGTHETHCGQKFRYKYEANNGKGVVTYAHVNQTRTVTPMWEFWRWRNGGAYTYQWTPPEAHSYREITSRTMYRYRDLIDTTPPTISSTGNPQNWTKENVTLTVTGSDAEAGVKSITLPDNTVVNRSSATYTVDRNGDYRFIVTDNLGNASTQTISVTKIDKTYPTYTGAEVKNITTDGYDVYIYGVSDGQSGVKEVRFPTWTDANGQDDLAPNWTTNPSVKGENLGNGTYKFRVNRSDHKNEFGAYITHIYMYDNVGNYDVKGVNYNLKDITKPTLTITGNPTNWTNQDVTLTINASDYGTGVRSITLPDGQVITGSSATYTVRENKDYTFKATDNAGNETTETVNVTKIDKTSPTITYTTNKTSESNATLTVTYSDTQSGIASIVKPNGTTKVLSSVTSTVTESETITQNSLILVSAVDSLGNKSSKSIDLLTLFATNTSSGVNRIEYKLTGATVKDWTTYTAPFYVTNEGITTVTARVYDNAGNLSSEKTSTVRIDKTKPTNNSILIELK